MKTGAGIQPISRAQIEEAMRLYLLERQEKPPARPVPRVGARIVARPYANAYWEGNGLPPRVVGTVVYVHPHGRYIAAEFRIGQAVVRECFPPCDVRAAREEGEICGIISPSEAPM